MRGLVERGGAAGARVDARRRRVFVVAAGEGGLGAFLAEDAELFFWWVLDMGGGYKEGTYGG